MPEVKVEVSAYVAHRFSVYVTQGRCRFLFPQNHGGSCTLAIEYVREDAGTFSELMEIHAVMHFDLGLLYTVRLCTRYIHVPEIFSLCERATS